MKRMLKWLSILAVAVALMAAGYVLATGSPQDAVARITDLINETSPAAAAANANSFSRVGNNGAATGSLSEAPDITAGQALTTTVIRPAGDVVGQVSAAGNLQLVSQRPVVLEVGGLVEEVTVRAGDEVHAGDLLVALDPSDLEQEVERALLNLRSAQLQLDDLLSAADPADIATAEADLKSAQESLAELQAGPDTRELAAARSNAAAAWARYNELLEGPSEEQLTQLSANLKKAEIALQEAQRAYDKIAWRGNVGETPQAAALQQATIDYESAKAAYEEATAPASTSDLQTALSQAESAQKQLEDLEQGASAAEIAAAEAQVASAEARLTELLAGADATDLANARISVEKAQMDLQTAADNLAASQVYAPMDGTVLEVNLEVGQRASAGQTGVVLANTQDLELVVNVAEVDISKVSLGQPASITIDALPGETFSGVVTNITPATTSQQGVVNYPVTIHLDDENLEQVRAGMTAVATIINQEQDAGWLVPANAVRQRGDASMVLVVRDDQPAPVQVTTGAVQGEWIVVHSPDLQAGDQVIGSTASFVDQETVPFGPPGADGQRPGGQQNPGGANPLRPLTRP